MHAPQRSVERVFDEWADEGRDQRMAASHRLTAGRVLEALPEGEGRRFLDLGTGNGWAAKEADAKGYRAVGVDVSRRMLQRARSQGVEVVRAAFEALPFRDETFARAFSMESLYYAQDLPTTVLEAQRVLEPEGILDAVMDRYQENPASHDWDKQLGVPMHLLSEPGWTNALRGGGFMDVQAQRLRAQDGSPWQATCGSLHVSGRRD